LATALVAAPGALANTLSAGALVQVPDKPLDTPGACHSEIKFS
jgi:hypothetical protein